MPTPQMNVTLHDGTLASEGQAPARNRRIIIFGTAARGPMLQAVSPADPAAVRSLFGDSSVGTLVKAHQEAWDAQIGSEKQPDIVLVRVGAEMAAKANHELNESGTSVLSMALYAVNEGADFNDVLVWSDASEFKIYNPILGQWAIFDIDFSNGPNDAYNDVIELSNAINLDPVASAVVEAVVNYKESIFELNIHPDDAGVTQSGSSLELALDNASPGWAAEASYLVLDNSAVVAAKNLAASIDGSGNLKSIHSLKKVYAITASDFVEIPANVREYEVPTGVVHKTLHSSFDALLNVTQPKDALSSGAIASVAAADADGSGWETPQSGDLSATHSKIGIANHGFIVGSKFTPGASAITGTNAADYNSTELAVTHIVDDDYVIVAVAFSGDEDLGASPVFAAEHTLKDLAKTDQYDSSAAVKGQAFEAFDDEAILAGNITPGTDTIELKFTSKFGIPVAGTGFDAYAGVIETALSLSDTPTLAELLPILPSEFSALFTVTVNMATGETFDVSAAAKLDFSAYNTGTYEVTLDVDTSGNTAGVSITASSNISSVTINGISAAGTMEEKAAGVSLTADTHYRFIDNLLKFGGVTTRRRWIRHLSRIDYGLDEVIVGTNDSDESTFTLQGVAPGFGTNGAITGEIIIGLQYEYAPAAFSTSINTSLKGGSAGLGIVNNPVVFKREVQNALYEVEDVEFSILIVPQFYIDKTYTTYEGDTGVEVVQNAGYASMLSSFLENTYGGHAVAIVEPSPMVGTGNNGAVTRADVTARFNQMAVASALDPLRPANTISAMDAKSLFLVDLEAQYSIDGSLYYNTSAAAIAGLLSTMDSDAAIYTKAIPNARALRYRYTERTASGESQMDALSDARVNVGNVDGAGRVFLTDGVLLAGANSDYRYLTTFWMVEKMLGIARRIGKGYLGKAPSRLMLQAFRNALESEFDQMVPNELTTYKLELGVNPAAKAAKEIAVEIQAVPAGETRAIGFGITLRDSEADIR